MTQKIEVDIDELWQITSWLAEVDIACIEIRQPGATVRLTMEQAPCTAGADAPKQAQVVSSLVPGGFARAAETAQTQAVSITAKSAGIFLSTHPARSAPLVSAGDHVEQGDIVGLVQIAQLCVPVIASSDGMVMRVCVAHSTTVGYGTPLFELSPSA